MTVGGLAPLARKHSRLENAQVNVTGQHPHSAASIILQAHARQASSRAPTEHARED